MSKYMRNKFPFLGLKAPARRALLMSFVASNKDKLHDRDILTGLLYGLWDAEEREFQGCGVDLLEQFKAVLLDGDDEKIFREAVSVAKHCVVTKSWWDTVDAIAYPGKGSTLSLWRP